MKWDDALDVWAAHGVGGTLGIILLGVFATYTVNPTGGQGLITGHWHVLRLAGADRRRGAPRMPSWRPTSSSS